MSEKLSNNIFNAKQGKNVKKNMPLFKILEGISIDEVNKLRGQSEVSFSVDKEATKINEVNLRG